MEGKGRQGWTVLEREKNKDFQSFIFLRGDTGDDTPLVSNYSWSTCGIQKHETSKV